MSFSHPKPPRRPAWRGPARVLAPAGALLLALAAGAQVTVTTLGGGPKVCNDGVSGPYAGFVAGNTLEKAQYSAPSALAFDAQSNLWVADTANNDVEQISLAGDRTDSITTHYAISGNFHAFTGVNGLAIDPGNNLYVLLPQTPEVLKYQISPPNLNGLASVTLPDSAPTAITVDGGSNLFVAFSGGAIIRFNMPNGTSSAAFTTIVSNFTWQPAGLALCANGQLAVSDLAGDAIYLVATNANSTPVLLTGGNGIGDANGAPGYAQFNQPRGLAATGDGRIIVCDESNNLVRLIDATGNTTTLYGTATNVWPASVCCSCSPQIFPGWLDGTSGPSGTSAAGRQPVGVTLSPAGTLYVTEDYYDLVREVTGAGIFPVNPSASAPSVTTEPATAITVSNAVFNAEVNPGDVTAAVYFQWGTNTAYGNYTSTNILSLNLQTAQPVSIGLSNQFDLLQAGTTYHFRAVATNSVSVTYGNDLSFTTPGTAAVVTTLPASNVTVNSALLNATVNPNGAVTAVNFQWGTSTNYATNTASINLTSNLNTLQAVSATISNLAPGATYYYTVVALNSAGSAEGNPFTFTTSNQAPPIVSFSPSSGYFPECVTITVTSTVPSVYYTENGTPPTTNSASVAMTFSNGMYYGDFQWCNSSEDLSLLQVVGITNGVVGPVASGSAPSVSEIGFPRTVSVGSGSTAYIPVVVALQSNTSLESVSFRVEISPNGSAPPISSIGLQQLTPNDYVQLPGPNASYTPVNFYTYAYTNALSNAYGLVISAAYDSGISIQNFGVPVLLEVPIPQNALYGASYTISVPEATGSPASMTGMAPQILQVTDPIYLDGDCYPPNGYNAGEFGNGQLEEGDLDTILYAVNHIRTPYTNSDAYNAMDVFPDTSKQIGFGVLSYNDWVVTLYRALGIDTNNWIRFWTNGGYLSDQEISWTPGGPAVPLAQSAAPLLSKAALNSSTPPGTVWFCQASIAAGSQTNVQPGQTCSLPLSINVLPGYSLTGLDFRAVVTPDNGGPAVAKISFNPATGAGIPAPYEQLYGSTSNDLICAWPPDEFEPPLQSSSNFLGTLTFQIPAGAQSGDSYSVHFAYTGGSPDELTVYQMESFPGTAWVQSGAAIPASLTSDDWKLAFFGSLTNALAADDADPDGDGAPNWQEYLAGTSPVSAQSCLKLSTAALSMGGQPAFAINWLTAPGKTYVLESQSALGGTNWTSLNTNTGDGNSYQLLVTNYSGQARFYQIRLQP